MWMLELLFSSILQIGYVEVRISQSVLENPLEIEITRIDYLEGIGNTRRYLCLYGLQLQSNLNGSNIFGTMEICSRYG